MQHFRVTTELPEPTATLHYVQQGERLKPIAARCYRQGIEPGRDLRFYENVMLTKELNGLTQGGKILQRDVKLELIERAIKLRNQIKNGGLPDKVVKELIEDGIHVEVKGKPVYKLAMLKFRAEGTELIA